MPANLNWTFMSLQIMHEIDEGKMTFAEMFPRAKAAGFGAYDASDHDRRWATVEEVVALCRENGLVIADYIHWLHMATPHESQVFAAIESGKQAVHIALAHGTKNLMIVESIVEEDILAMGREAAIASMARVLREIVSYAAGYGVTVMVEDFGNPVLPMATSDQIGHLLHAAPGLKLILDTGNMLIQGQDPVEFTRQLLDHVAYVHLKDVEFPDAPTTLDYDHDHTGRIFCEAHHGEGIVNFPAIFSLLRSHGYEGFATVEYTPHIGTVDNFAKMARSIRYLNGLQ